ncbi:MAG: CopG family transcriptional regulator, partial [Acidimicrobiales bacterium]
MQAVRTQVYLTQELRQRIDLVAIASGVTMAEVIRRALDAYLVDDVDCNAALSATFGANPSASAPPRDEW